MGRHSTGGLYLNFGGFGEEKDDLVKSAFGDNYERLPSKRGHVFGQKDLVFVNGPEEIVMKIFAGEDVGDRSRLRQID